MADWLRNVVQEEDGNVGLKLQQGLETGLMKSVFLAATSGATSTSIVG